MRNIILGSYKSSLSLKSRFVLASKLFMKLTPCGVDVGISASLANASAAMFQLLTLKHVETCIDMMTDTKHFVSMFLKEKHL